MAFCYLLFAICYLFDSFGLLAHVAELADAYGSGPYGATRGGSSPLVSTNVNAIALFCGQLEVDS